MNTYHLIEGRNLETNWFEQLDEKDEEKIERIALKFSTGMARQFLSGKKGLDSDKMNNFLWQYISNFHRYLNEGKVLLFNRVGGIMFLDEGINILKTVECSSFPYFEENLGLSGWLTPNGEFYMCNHGEHWKFAKENFNNAKEELHDLDYISMGSVGYEFNKYSHLSIPLNGLTEEQRQWFNVNYRYLDVEQKQIYEKYLTI